MPIANETSIQRMFHMHQQTQVQHLRIELYVEFEHIAADDTQHDPDVQDDRVEAYEGMNNNSEEEFEATYETGNEDEDGDGGGEASTDLIIIPQRIYMCCGAGCDGCTDYAVMPEIAMGDDKEIAKTLHNALLAGGVAAKMPLSQSTVTFVLLVSEVTVTLKDVLHIFGLPIDGEVVIGWTDSSQDFLWSHHPRTKAWMSRSAASIRQGIDYMNEGRVIAHSSVSNGILRTEWFASMGMHNSPPLPTRVIPIDQHCFTLRGVQCHDWSRIHDEWIQQWDNHHNSQLRERHLQPIAEFSPSTDYQSWYLGLFGMYLKLSNVIPQQPSQQPPQQAALHYAVFQSFPYHRLQLSQPSQNIQYSQHHSSHHNQQSHHGFQYADFPPFSPHVDT
ncbi:hypothetical protein AHAS_Ahas17G0297400 [Arachis hypogaea]